MKPQRKGNTMSGDKNNETSRDYLEQALHLAKQQLPGWAWAMIHQAARGYAGGKGGIAKEAPPDIQMSSKSEIKAKTLEGFDVVFVVAETNDLEAARGKLLVGADGVTFNEVYLKALGMSRDDVGVCTLGELPSDIGNTTLVALGKGAKAGLGERAAVSMPHPTAIRKLGDSGEVGRKAKAVKNALTKPALRGDTSSKHAESKSALTVEIAKTDEDKRIVYGVVLDPYKVDAHGDLISPAEVEKTAHGWMSKSRVVGLQHSEMADAVPVESWLVPYPSEKDYKAAMTGKPHKANRTVFGTDTIHSGTWVLGTRLGKKEWALVKSGELNAYSIGGFGKRSPLGNNKGPEVEFLEVGNGEK
ncbi:hypothetical protein CMI37_18105 [Candidatus Pacearchaeota archaeon]|nr:hypothetical protein [Candidatus Pacearchaeota archaeon]